MTSDQLAKAAQFRALHTNGVFVLPNAWDSASAAMIAAAGAPVVATTSAGMSWALGRSDGQGLTRDEMVAAIERIVSTVGELPVSVDSEGGY
jgi:2-methylisocitrate lyase-like PEP mutase family enzyme